jgi:trans-aconitate methyltransferase
MERAARWNATFAAGDEERSWYEPRPARSLRAIEHVVAPGPAAIIDVGGGSSRLCGALLTAGYTDVTVLDLSETALDIARRRVEESAQKITWIACDLLQWRPTRRYAVWHDRALLHFFRDVGERRTYAETLRTALQPGGHAIIATFAPHGPAQCSGLPVQRSSGDEILDLLDGEFTIVENALEIHTTPSGSCQPFTWLTARRRSPAPDH